MILEHTTFDLLGKKVFERMRFHAPLKVAEFMHEEACLIYAVEGNATLFGSENQDFKKGESMFMKCGNFINYYNPVAGGMPTIGVAVHFYPEVIKLIFENRIPAYLTIPNNPQEKSFVKIGKNKVLKSYIESLMIYFDNPVIFNEETKILKLRELIALLYSINEGGIREILSDMFNEREREFRKVIANHLFKDLSLEDLAVLLNLSLASFKRKFKELYGIPPGQYRMAKKLERAAELLQNTNHRVVDVCYECGFRDLSNFTRVFTKHYGVSPSTYKLNQ